MIQFQTARVQSFDINNDRDTTEADVDPCSTLVGPLPVVLLIVALRKVTQHVVSVA